MQCDEPEMQCIVNLNLTGQTWYLRYGLVGDSEKYTDVLSCSSSALSRAPMSEGSKTVAVTPILGSTVWMNWRVRR